MNVNPKPPPLAVAGRRTIEIVLGVAVGIVAGLLLGCVIAALVYPAYTKNGHTIADPRLSPAVWYGGIVGPGVYAVASTIAGIFVARKVNLALGTFIIAFAIGIPVPTLAMVLFLGAIFGLH